MSLASLSNTTATIQRPTVTADAYGGESATFAALLSNFACTIQPRGGREIVENGQRIWVRMYNLYSATDITSARPGDRVVHDSINYIVDSACDMAGRGSHFKLELIRKT